MKRFITGCIVLSVFLIACSKSSQGGGSGDLAPTNLTVSATAVADSSGNVNITASASNAVSYDIDMGNGVIQTSATGVLTYKYLASGTYTINVVARSSSGQTTSANANVTVAVKRNLIWSDEFNTDGAPDPNKWGYDLGGGGWGNSELEYYTNRSQNVIVQNGVLKIIALKESYNGSAYTSARLLTKNKFAFTYGHVDIRAQLPGGMGPWPALWMLGSNVDTVTWPACGEMDIMEENGNNPNVIYGTLHYPGHSGANGNGATTTVPTANTSFHIYSLDWSPSAVKIYVDGNLYQTVANSPSVPFNHDFFLIFNLAMGGTFGGTVDPAITSATLQVDYIRVYQ